MKSDLRIVIDTGVVVSAVLLPGSVPRQAFDLAGSQGRLLVSVATAAELDEVLRRQKLDKYVSEARRLEFLAAFRGRPVAPVRNAASNRTSLPSTLSRP
ncbi:MAG: hypothetical protein NTY19_37360 [Planctomycetota bacterium]|nr:hypothetical protein [Planctomycetota bacterium]